MIDSGCNFTFKYKPKRRERKNYYHTQKYEDNQRVILGDITQKTRETTNGNFQLKRVNNSDVQATLNCNSQTDDESDKENIHLNPTNYGTSKHLNPIIEEDSTIVMNSTENLSEANYSTQDTQNIITKFPSKLHVKKEKSSASQISFK